MSTALLATKLQVPRLSTSAVSRPRLTDRLVAGLREGRRLTVLSASAGYGKPTLLVEWLPDTVCWKGSVTLVWCWSPCSACEHESKNSAYRAPRAISRRRSVSIARRMSSRHDS